MNDLKPCPFCGGKPFRQVEYENGFKGIVRCPVCNIEIQVKKRDDLSFITEERIVDLLRQATDSWNTRA